MKTKSLAGLLVALACVVATAGPAAARTESDEPERLAEHVVLVVWDGFDPDYLTRVPTPNLDALARRGVKGQSTGVLPSITNPSMASLATGAYPERHRNTAYFYDQATGKATGQTRRLDVETLAQSLAAQGHSLASIQWFILQNYGVTYGDPKALYTQPGGTCETRVNQFTDLLAGRPVNSGGTLVAVPEIPDLMAVYCGDLDTMGHEIGADDPRLAAQMAEMDRQLGRIVQATRDAGIYDETAFLVVGDHGMTTFSKPAGNELLAAIAKAGYKGEFVSPGGSPAADTDVVIVVGGSASLHLRGDALEPGAAGRIHGAVSELPQVQRIFGKAEQRVLGVSPDIGELLVEPKPGWTLGPTAPSGGVAGRHGSTTEMYSGFFLAGAGVGAAGTTLNPRHIDIAPTVAALLGARPPAAAQGRVLWEVLQG